MYFYDGTQMSDRATKHIISKHIQCFWLKVLVTQIMLICDMRASGSGAMTTSSFDVIRNHVGSSCFVI